MNGSHVANEAQTSPPRIDNSFVSLLPLLLCHAGGPANTLMGFIKDKIEWMTVEGRWKLG